MLDSQLGKIVCVPRTGKQIATGALISYDIAHQTSLYFIHSIELLYIPFDLARDDILFLHHVFELCYYFVPVGSSPHPSFALLRFLYTTGYKLSNTFLKKVFLFKLFTLLGIYPEEKEFSNPYFNYLVALSVDMIVNESVDLEVERELERWLNKCVLIHPCVEYFKTTYFLNGSRVV